MRNFILPVILSFSFLLASCGSKSGEGEVLSALEESYLALSDGDCDRALSELDSIPYDKSNPEFLKAYSSAYACKAGYSTINIFAYELDKFKTAGNLLNQLARFSTSNKMTSPDDADFVNMTKALEVLTTVDRSKFSQDAQEDIESQIAFMQLVQLGMYVNYYGNVDVDGNKGLGSAGNKCFLTYNDPQVTQVIAAFQGAFGACTDPYHDVGHRELISSGNLNVENICRGIVAVNTAVEIFPRVIANADTNLLDKSWVDQILEYKQLLVDSAPGLKVIDVFNQDECVKTLNDSANPQQEAQAFFLLLESLLL